MAPLTPNRRNGSGKDRYHKEPSSSPLSILSRTPSPPSEKEPRMRPSLPYRKTASEALPEAVSAKGPQSAPEKVALEPLPATVDTPSKKTPNGDPTLAPRSSGRNREPPRILSTEVEAEGRPVKKVKLNESNVVRKRQPIRGNWSAQFLLQNAKSKLATINLMDLLYNEKAWTSLEREQQLKLISMLPNASLLGWSDSEELPNVPKEFLKTNRSMQADVRLFQEDLRAGRHEPSWQRSAAEAMEMRASGDFDDWKERNREEFWGQKQKTTWDAPAGDSARHSLGELVEAGCFEVGDMWRLRRGMGHGKTAVVVEREATITTISPSHTLAFRFPLGQLLSGTAGHTDIEVDNVASPKALSDAILEEDGRIPDTVRGSNSWLEFRCVRRNQDMGSLWDMRELYHKKMADTF